MDNKIFYANDDTIFPNPQTSKNWLSNKGYAKTIHATMPGDVLDLETNTLNQNNEIKIGQL